MSALKRVGPAPGRTCECVQVWAGAVEVNSSRVKAGLGCCQQDMYLQHICQVVPEHMGCVYGLKQPRHGPVCPGRCVWGTGLLA